MQMTVTREWKCDLCGAIHSDGHRGGVGMSIDTHYVPLGWSYIRGHLVCNQHRMRIENNEAGIISGKPATFALEFNPDAD